MRGGGFVFFQSKTIDLLIYSSVIKDHKTLFQILLDVLNGLID